MILVDTNVISETLRQQPDPAVVRWMDTQSIETLYLSAVTVAELRYGIAVLPEGRRRQVLHSGLEQSVLPLFEGRILPFDGARPPSGPGGVGSRRLYCRHRPCRRFDGGDPGHLSVRGGRFGSGQPLAV